MPECLDAKGLIVADINTAIGFQAVPFLVRPSWLDCEPRSIPYAATKAYQDLYITNVLMGTVTGVFVFAHQLFNSAGGCSWPKRTAGIAWDVDFPHRSRHHGPEPARCRDAAGGYVSFSCYWNSLTALANSRSLSGQC